MKMVMHYPLVPGQDFKLPDACQVLSVGLREDDLVLYAFIDTSAPLRERDIVVIGTGQEVLDPRVAPGAIVGTAIHPVHGAFHVFDLGWVEGVH